MHSFDAVQALIFSSRKQNNRFCDVIESDRAKVSLFYRQHLVAQYTTPSHRFTIIVAFHIATHL